MSSHRRFLKKFERECVLVTSLERETSGPAPATGALQRVIMGRTGNRTRAKVKKDNFITVFDK
jgi:hypothetical protein